VAVAARNMDIVNHDMVALELRLALAETGLGLGEQPDSQEVGEGEQQYVSVGPSATRESRCAPVVLAAVLLMRLCWQMLASPPPLLSFSRRVCSHFLRPLCGVLMLKCSPLRLISPCSSGRQRA